MRSNTSYGEALSVALHSLRSSKLRSLLTLLGIILATTTLIAVMSVIKGMDVYIAEKVSDMGADGFRVFRMAFVGNFDPKKYLELLRKNPQLRREEYEFLKSHVRLVSEIGMQSAIAATVAAGREKLDRVSIRGATPNLAAIANIQVAAGRFITEPDNQRRLPVAFIGNDLRDTFFAGVDPIGKIIRIDGRSYEVIGAAKALGSVFGQSKDNFAFIPIETYFKSYGSRSGISYVAKAIDQQHLFQAQDEIRMRMRAFRHLRPGQEDNFSIVSSDSLVQAWNQLTGAVAATAVGVVSVFMVVGGVVIMNIMLAVVTERTHEIGIRKAVGARRGDILRQFLVESAILALAGGMIGVLSAAVVTLLVKSFTPVPVSIPLSAVLTGIGLSAGVGLFFGIYPASRAARMDPIEALRVER